MPPRVVVFNEKQIFLQTERNWPFDDCIPEKEQYKHIGVLCVKSMAFDK